MQNELKSQKVATEYNYRFVLRLYCTYQLITIILNNLYLREQANSIAKYKLFSQMCLKWADPGCSAMPGQPAAGQEQAPKPRQSPKISLIYWTPCRGRIRY